MRPARRLVVVIASVLLIAQILGSSPVWAGDSAKDRASDQMKWGYQAARRGYWLEALDRFERANQLTPGQPRILNNIAVALEASGRFEEALLAYETALAVAPSDRVLQRNFAQFKEFYDAQIADQEPPGEGDAEDSSGSPAAGPDQGGEESDNG